MNRSSLKLICLTCSIILWLATFTAKLMTFIPPQETTLLHASTTETKRACQPACTFYVRPRRCSSKDLETILAGKAMRLGPCLDFKWQLGIKSRGKGRATTKSALSRQDESITCVLLTVTQTDRKPKKLYISYLCM